MIRPEEARRPLTVTELSVEIRRQLRPLSPVLVRGEVSGVKRTGKGNYSFTVRDQGAAVQAFLYGDDARRLGIVPEDGQVFVFRGRVDLWQSGQLSLVVDFIQFDDVGRLRAQLEAVRRRLELEGAFEVGRKRALPFLPRVVALVTSPTGAVIHDLQETILDRYPNMEILVYPAQVQGTASPGSVVMALRRCNQDGRADVVVIARGGGSFEELYAFNTEPVARAILASRTPVVTALGHTSDRTLADLVADAECRTPTEAGARIVPRKADLAAGLVERRRRVAREATRLLAGHAERLVQRRQRLVQALPGLARRAEPAQLDTAALQPLSAPDGAAADAAGRARRSPRGRSSQDTAAARHRAGGPAGPGPARTRPRRSVRGGRLRAPPSAGSAGGAQPPAGPGQGLQHHPGRGGARAALRGRDGSRPRHHRAAGGRHPGRPRRGGPRVTEELSYERALELLDQKLKALEDGNLALDEALTVVDEARGYLLTCERRLEEARRRIEVRPDGADERGHTA